MCLVRGQEQHIQNPTPNPCAKCTSSLDRFFRFFLLFVLPLYDISRDVWVVHEQFLAENVLRHKIS
mgnify:CR=1 FL=1